MAIYTPVTQVMPVASMVTGAAVTAALGDQIRDNLVALYDGWWFRASKATTFSSNAAAGTPFELDTIVMSQSGEDDGTIALSGGDVVLRKTGLWLLGGHYQSSTTITLVAYITATDALGGLAICESGTDTATSHTDVSCSGVLEVITVPSTVSFNYYTASSISITASTRSPFMWGIWLGDRP